MPFPMPFPTAISLALMSFLPASGCVVMTPVSRLPTVGHPMVPWTRFYMSARHPSMALAFPPPIPRRPDVAGTRPRNDFDVRRRRGHRKINGDVGWPGLGYSRHCDLAQGSNRNAQQYFSHRHCSISCLDEKVSSAYLCPFAQPFPLPFWRRLGAGPLTCRGSSTTTMCGGGGGMGTLTETWGGWGGRGWATAGIATALKTIDAHSSAFRMDIVQAPVG